MALPMSDSSVRETPVLEHLREAYAAQARIYRMLAEWEGANGVVGESLTEPECDGVISISIGIENRTASIEKRLNYLIERIGSL